MADGIQGVQDEYDDLISAFYHLRRGDWSCSQYALDAKRAEDKELAAFFQDARAQYQQLAERAKLLLLARLSAKEGAVSQEEVS